ncbi:MAG: hypothetical protein ACM3ML_33450 [Micromonosporaceae bacterium]
MASRLSQWLAVTAAATMVQRASGTVLLILPADQDVVATVAALCAAETGCCPQTRFVLEISNGAAFFPGGYRARLWRLSGAWSLPGCSRR